MLANKKFFISEGSLHFGEGKPKGGYKKSDIEAVKDFLANIGEKKLWRCFVCNDLHIGSEPPEECPTCLTMHAYCEISAEEFNILIGLKE